MPDYEENHFLLLPYCAKVGETNTSGHKKNLCNSYPQPVDI